MMNYFDLTNLIPGLENGQWLHVVNAPLAPLANTLVENGFAIFVIEGAEITDRDSFFHHVKNTFGFPDYFGNNWAAWNDCLSDFKQALQVKTAIIWKDADKTFLSDAKVFIQAAFDLYNLTLEAGHINNPRPCQVEFFLLGDNPGFKNALDLN
ncbi:MAG: barstar family protein [Chloroflexota bacterium]